MVIGSVTSSLENYMRKSQIKANNNYEMGSPVWDEKIEKEDYPLMI